MPDEGMSAVAEAVEPVNAEVNAGESTESTGSDDGQPKVKEGDKQDNRHQPDALKKHIADLRRRADSITDPVEKQAELDRIKFLYDTSGKARGYEQEFKTVREAREVRALLEAVGGRDGVTQMQSTLSEMEQNNQKLAAGDPSLAEMMWEKAPDGMQKLMPAMLDKFAQAKPQEFEKFIAPRTIGSLDQAGFPQAFDRMVKLYDAGKVDEAQAVRNELIQWVAGNRQAAQQQKQADPEVERLRAELAKRDQGQEAQKVDAAYSDVVSHAGPAIDRVAAPIIGKYGFTREEATAFRQAVWNHLQEARNGSDTYKTIAPAKQKQGYDKWTEYAKRWTDDNAETSIRAVLKTPPWSRLAGTKTPVTTVTQQPKVVSIQQGKHPAPDEINYDSGVAALKKAGLWKPQYHDLSDALMDGVAPLKAGGFRKFR